MTCPVVSATRHVAMWTCVHLGARVQLLFALNLIIEMSFLTLFKIFFVFNWNLITTQVSIVDSHAYLSVYLFYKDLYWGSLWPVASATRHIVMWTRVCILMCSVATGHWTQTIPIFINNWLTTKLGGI